MAISDVAALALSWSDALRLYWRNGIPWMPFWYLKSQWVKYYARKEKDMSENINLASDEAVLLQADDVNYRSGDRSGKGFLAASSHDGTLTLTNKRINFSYSTGTFKKVCESVDIPLSEIKVFDGVAQFKAIHHKDRYGFVSLIAYLANGEYEFEFSQKNKKKALTWLNAVNQAITGLADYWTINDVGGVDIAKTIRGAIQSAAPVVSDIVDAAKPLTPIAAAAVTKKIPRASNILGAVVDSLVSKKDDNQNQLTESSSAGVLENENVEYMSLDEQMEAVQKLKDLYDAGILTQEEFELKKKQIMDL